MNSGNLQLQNVGENTPTICDPMVEKKGSSTSSGNAIAGSVCVIFIAGVVGLHLIAVEKRKWNPEPVQRALGASAQNQARAILGFGSVLTVCVLICFASTAWIHLDSAIWGVDCNLGLTTISCNEGSTTLTGDMKSAGDVMAGCGAMAFIAMIALTVISACMSFGKDFGMAPKLCMAALGLCVWTFMFLTAGWVNYAVEDGGIEYWDDIGAEYGPSFGFTVVMWLLFLVYWSMWRNFHKSVTGGAMATISAPKGTGKQQMTETPPMATAVPFVRPEV